MGSRWLFLKLGFGQKQAVNKEYFKGLNFLLNEEPDKAIEVFIKALEVDSETVELHLALGGLFRRKGQVDRATRIHQNLIARPSLTDDQRMQAIHELAQDYYKAGWLDRAENLFSELKDSAAYRVLAVEGLVRIYQQEKEWQKAIDVLRLLKRGERQNVSKQVAHYYCELAELSIGIGDFQIARQHLRNARGENPSIARSLLLRGDLRSAEGDHPGARELWLTLAVTHENFAELIVEKMITSFTATGDSDGLENYLLNVSVVPKNADSFKVWQNSLESVLGQSAAIDHIIEKSSNKGISSPLASYLNTALAANRLSDDRSAVLLKKMLSRAKSKKIEYTCVGCGFDTKAMYWFCPNCGQWESFR
ncbi:MAG: lipopolysaccharide biosynthesis regulator YciM [Arenicella sp.]|jgi:lipopolysaccharide biosynthesis regulator YciM